MTAPSPTGRRLRIDRLELDLRGIGPGTADSAARALGPALARALASHRAPATGARRIDAGRIASKPSPVAHDLASNIAQRIAHTLKREGT
jgi:hypothetical protein